MAKGNGDSCFAPDENVTPACNLIRLTSSHWRDYGPAYDRLATRLGNRLMAPPRLSVDACSTAVLNEIRSGTRHLVWCPPGIDLFTALFHFFARRNIGLSLPRAVGRDLTWGMATQLGAWAIFSARLSYGPAAHGLASGQSGVFATYPNAVQLAYLAAWSMSFREDACPVTEYPYPSAGMDGLVFVRTATRFQDGRVMGMAYLPGRALIFRLFKAESPPDSLAVADAFLL